ncbi:MAG: hypothetical protein RR132_05515 [Rikenellaceae bacterium]
MAYTRFNYLERVRDVQHAALEKYEIGRQDRCWRWTWRHHIRDRYHISYHSFLNMLKINVESEIRSEHKRIAEKSLKHTFFDGMDI